MSKKYNVYQSHSFYCQTCGRQSLLLPRPASRLREKFHTKTLYCPWCKQVTQHIECKTQEEEFEFKQKFSSGDLN